MDAASRLRRMVEEAAEGTPYAVESTEDGFDLVTKVDDERWRERFRTGSVSFAMVWHVKVRPGGTYTILDDRRFVEWEAGVARLGGRFERQVGRITANSWSATWEKGSDGKYQKVDETNTAFDDGRAMITTAAAELGLRKKAHWVVIVAAMVGAVAAIGAVITAGVLLWALVSATDVDVSVSEQPEDPPSPSGPEVVDGKIVGDAVEREVSNLLRRDIEGLVPGKLDCRELEYELDATTTCERAVVIDGHYMTMDVDVEITALKGMGKMSLYVQIADEVNTYGTTGEELERAIGKDARKFYTLPVKAVDCPDLEGREGHRVRCTLSLPGGDRVVQVTAHDVDLSVPTMSYRFREIHGSD